MATPHRLPKKRGALKNTQKSLLFFRGTQVWRSHTKASLKRAKSLDPMPPSDLDWIRVSHFTH